MKTKVLVTGANGQLGQCLQFLASKTNIEFIFLGSNELDVTSKESINKTFNSTFNFCVNCAAYTAVDKAEEEFEKANLINNIAVKNIAESCKKNNITLIHISTDFVFSGENNIPYKESDETNPISVYGQTKLEGERAIQQILDNYFIIRTSWLYSQFGNNFVKSMLNLAKAKDKLGVVSDQIGTPTYAIDLAKVVLELIKHNKNFGLYHYSNQGVASWYDFAKAIFEYSNITLKVNSIPSEQYPTPAKRPSFSVLDKTKIQKNLNLETPYWRESLKKCLKNVF